MLLEIKKMMTSPRVSIRVLYYNYLFCFFSNFCIIAIIITLLTGYQFMVNNGVHSISDVYVLIASCYVM